MANYRLTNKAKSDLADIWDYTIQTWSQNQAQRYYEQFIESFIYIASNPNIGKDYSEVTQGLLGLSVGKHLVFYQKENKNSVLIIRILHQRIDLKKRLD